VTARATGRPERAAPREGEGREAARGGDPLRREFHFVFGLRPQREAFHLAHFLALASCRAKQAPDAIHLHCRHVPWGPWWERIAPHLELHRVGATPRGFDPRRYAESPEGRLIADHGFDYAHEADFVRLEVLRDAGGAYADIDTLFVARYPDAWFAHDCVLGEEPALAGPDGVLRPSLCNAVILARAGAPFVARWLDEARRSFDGTWSRHSCEAAARLWSEAPGEVHVLPSYALYRHGPTLAGIHALFEERDERLDGVASLHLWAHLWWDEARTDFTDFHAGRFTEAWVAAGTSTVARVAQRFLGPGSLA
jgi:hypothetical protein